MVSRLTVRYCLFLLFALSGFAGLIYESIWSHYLKLFLGHAAYAQTLVLCIFMGGMAIGAALAGNYSSRVRSPLLVYVLVEAILGLAALGFDFVFRSMQAWAYGSLLPALAAEPLVDLSKWTLGTLLILPQSVLLGATFPLITAAIVRLDSESAGNSLGWLYFTNSLGAAMGVLTSGFLLVDLVGLPGTILTGGLINFVLAALVYCIARSGPVQVMVASTGHAASVTGLNAQSRLLLWTAALTGTASFIYEIAWIRMLSLVIGSATHSFELMLSAFITGLALGSFYIRRRLDQGADCRSQLGWIQVTMGALALLTIPLYMLSFDALAAWMRAIQRSEEGYVAYTLFSHLLCFLLMLPATFLAGMTLPLITTALLRKGSGEGGIGRVYASNTLGSIAGVLLAVHLLMPGVGLRYTVICGALLDITLGIFLLAGPPRTPRWTIAIASALVCLVLAMALRTEFDPNVTGSGVFRHGESRQGGKSLFHADGKTATVDVFRSTDGIVSIATNGKVDAGIDIRGSATPDDHTMVLAALLPLAHHARIEDAAVIGMGSGRSTHALLHSRKLRSVDTIEIESAMVEGARQFGDYSRRAFEDPRHRIHIEDAKAYFARRQKQYDLILSEPSNPWVSGVASLFSTNFYEEVGRYLRPGGIFMQWIHLYEIDQALLATVINALSEHFGDYVAYVSNGADLLLLATKAGPLPPLDKAALRDRDLEPLWDHLDIRSVAALELRRIGSRASIAPWSRSIDVRANSDYFPVLDQGAAKQRFLGSRATVIHDFRAYAARLELGDAGVSSAVEPFDDYVPVALSNAAHSFAVSADAAGDPAGDAGIYNLRRDLWEVERDCASIVAAKVWFPALKAVVRLYAAYLPDPAASMIAARLRAARCLAVEPQARSWVDLLEGISQNNWKLTRDAALALLGSQKPGAEHEDFIVAELLLAELKIGGYPAARGRIADLDRRMLKKPVIAFLRANIGG